ncbi:C-C motif chemokine 4-like protein [Huso huso]|uniref:C-C motif chemokine n=1 Tax=Huso huso TaxID=61971 RepID=A0ABR0ZXV5_HUSHU
MKFTHLVMAALLIAALCSQTLGSNAHTPDICCFSYHKVKLQRKTLARYEVTRTDCTKPGVVLVTRSGKQTCVNPAEPWVKDRMQYLDQIFSSLPVDS